MNPIEQIAAVFQAEVAEQLDALGQAVESLPGLAPEARREPLERCMRLAHNIKGIAASVGYQEIRQLAHAAETAFSAHQADPSRPIEPSCAAVLEAVTAMQQSAQGRDLGAEPTAALVARLTGAAAPAAAPGAKASEPTAAPSESAAAAAAAASAASVRVESVRLDKLMTYTGELLSTHARLAARGEGLLRLHETLEHRLGELEPAARAAMSPVLRELEGLLEADRRELGAFGRLTRDLGAAMKQVRMMRLDGLGPAWRQLVRESAQQLGRRVELTVEVGEIEIDKYVLDRIRDPLIHLLRNSVAHGIEPAAERAAKHKPEAGRVSVRASLQGAQVLLEVCDDGRGLDAQRIGEAAVRKGLLDPARLAKLQPAEIHALIFEEGFSTAEAVGQVSGRGVGLNVVKSNVSLLGGLLAVSPTSRLGGARFELTLPVSVVSRTGLLVRAGTSVYALPIEHVRRTVRVALETLEKVDGEPVVRSSGSEPIRLRRLAQLMGRPGERVGGLTKVVILERGESRLGLAVDEVLREEEYVVKPLPRNLAGVVGVDGVVILADGALAIAVNVPDLFQAASERSPGSSGSAAPGGDPAPGPTVRKRILVADDMLTARALHRGILEAAGHEVVLAADGEEAWAALRREHFDLLVSDVQMPRLDGCALTARIRGDAQLRDLPVILVTSLGTPAEIAAGGKAGANGYLVKGQYESEKLLASIRRFA